MFKCNSPQHLKSKESFPSRPQHIPIRSHTTSQSLTALSPSTVTENELTVGNYYETPSSPHDDQVTTTTLGVNNELDDAEGRNYIKDDHYQNNELSMGNCHEEIIIHQNEIPTTKTTTTSLHDYCIQVSDLIYNL